MDKAQKNTTMKHKRIPHAVNLLIVMAICFMFGNYLVGLLKRNTMEPVDYVLLGLLAAVVFWIIVTDFRDARRIEDWEEPYERYSVQVADGQMIDFPIVVKHNCLRSMSAAIDWATKNTADRQSYRIIDLADGAVISINGTPIAKKEDLHYHATPPLGSRR